MLVTLALLAALGIVVIVVVVANAFREASRDPETEVRASGDSGTRAPRS